jgi:sulfur carrier protein ThiS
MSGEFVPAKAGAGTPPIGTQFLTGQRGAGEKGLLRMRVKLNTKEREFPSGTRLAQVVKMIRQENQDDPVMKSLVEKTGRDHLTFIYNHRIVKPEEYDSIKLKEGDEIRWMYPYAGG